MLVAFRSVKVADVGRPQGDEATVVEWAVAGKLSRRKTIPD